MSYAIPPAPAAPALHLFLKGLASLPQAILNGLRGVGWAMGGGWAVGGRDGRSAHMYLAFLTSAGLSRRKRTTRKAVSNSSWEGMAGGVAVAAEDAVAVAEVAVAGWWSSSSPPSILTTRKKRTEKEFPEFFVLILLWVSKIWEGTMDQDNGAPAPFSQDQHCSTDQSWR